MDTFLTGISKPLFVFRYLQMSGEEFYLWQAELSPEDGKDEIDRGVSEIN
jgi:hypothetical protein